MQVRTHPHLNEAIISHNGVISRWSLTDPPKLLVDVEREAGEEESDDIAVAPQGELFATCPQVRSQEAPEDELEGSTYGLIELRDWRDLQVAHA